MKFCPQCDCEFTGELSYRVCERCGLVRCRVPTPGDERGRAAGLASHLAASATDSAAHVSDDAMRWLLERYAGECALLAKAITEGWDAGRFEAELVALPIPGN